MPRYGTIPTSALEANEVAAFQFVELIPPGGDTYRLTNYPGGINFDFGDGVQAWSDEFGLEMGDISYDQASILSVSQIALANIDYEFTTVAVTDGLRTASVRIWEVYFDPRNIGSSLGWAPLYSGEVDDFVLDQHAVLTLTPHDKAWSRKSPPQKIGSSCLHRFKGPECGYAGVDASCQKTRAACTAKSNLSRFGGFDLIPPEAEILRW